MLRTCIVLGSIPLAGAWAQEFPSPEPKFAYRLDEIARAVGVQPLRDGRGLPAGKREVRIWIGFGLFQPETFTRIQSDGKSVRGQHVFWWSAATDRAEESNELYANLRKRFGCGPRRRRAEYEMCGAALAAGQSWAGILASLDSHRVSQLPDGTSFGLDGWTMVVELREGSGYHSYSYFMPDTGSRTPEVRSAAAIAELVMRIGYRE